MVELGRNWTDAVVPDRTAAARRKTAKEAMKKRKTALKSDYCNKIPHDVTIRAMVAPALSTRRARGLHRKCRALQQLPRGKAAICPGIWTPARSTRPYPRRPILQPGQSCWHDGGQASGPPMPWKWKPSGYYQFQSDNVHRVS